MVLACESILKLQFGKPIFGRVGFELGNVPVCIGTTRSETVKVHKCYDGVTCENRLAASTCSIKTILMMVGCYFLIECYMANTQANIWIVNYYVPN